MATGDVTFFSEDHGFGLVSRDVDDHVSICFFSVNVIGYQARPDDEGMEYTFRRTDGAHDLTDRYSLFRRYEDGSLRPTGVAT